MMRAELRQARGFTMVELIVTLIIVGILAVTVMPRFADRRDFEAAGYADQVRASLEYARNAAIAARRNVCVAIGSGAAAGSLTFTRASAAGDGAACAAALAIPQRGAGENVLTRPSSLAASDVGGTLGGFVFRASGAASGGGTLTVGSHTLTVVAATGYVY
jgi:MSHA pilin protein MshC